MHLLMEKFKISNFLSFFDVYEINLKPFTAIMCNYEEGKVDFLKALEFVFGSDTNVKYPLNFLHKVFKKEFLEGRNIQCYVEVTLNLVAEGKQLVFRRSIIRGLTSARIEHRISNIITTKALYNESLKSLNLYIQQKNLIFYKSYFNSCIWGSSEDLEMTINTCLRNEYLWENWTRANKNVKYWRGVKERAAKNKINLIKKHHDIVTKCASEFESALINRESMYEENLKKMMDFLEEENSDESTDAIVDDVSECHNYDLGKIFTRISELEYESCFLADELHTLNLKEAELTSTLYYKECKMAERSSNENIIKRRINELKREIHQKENQISEIWRSVRDINSEIENISINISESLILLHENQADIYLQNRFTTFGRFVDYLQPGRYVEILRHIIGNDIFYAHLCDTFETAFDCLNLMKILKYERPETFIIFENYSHHLKDIITASGEKGVLIRNLEQLLVFLCKLCHYGLIDKVPVAVQRYFDFDSELPPLNDYVAYIQDGLYFDEDGLMRYESFGKTFCMKTDEEIKNNLVKLSIEEELKYRELDNLFFKRFEILTDLAHLENDISYLKQKRVKPIEFAKKKNVPISEIYEEYRNIFTQYNKEREKVEEDNTSQTNDSLLSEAFIDETNIEASSCELVDLVLQNVNDIHEKKEEIQNKLDSLNKELRTLHVVNENVENFQGYEIRKHCVRFDILDKTVLFFDKEIRELKKLMAKDELEEFLSFKEWRESLISSLIEDLSKTNSKLKHFTDTLKYIGNARKNQLHPFIEHCSQYLPSTFNNLTGEALPFIRLIFDSEENLQILSCLESDTSKVIGIQHFNAFVRFISVLSIFLELTNFESIPLMVLEDIEEFFPLKNDNLEAVFDSSVVEKIMPENKNHHFHLLMRVGKFFLSFIQKNAPGSHMQKNGNARGTYSKHILTNLEYLNLNNFCQLITAGRQTGPMQMIYFSNGDLINAAKHYLWIQMKILPDEYITEDCNSFSAIHELNLDF